MIWRISVSFLENLGLRRRTLSHLEESFAAKSSNTSVVTTQNVPFSYRRVGAQSPLFSYFVSRGYPPQGRYVLGLPRCTIDLCKIWKLARSIKSVSNELPILKVLACVDWNPRKGLEAGCRTEEGVVPFRHKDATGVRMEARQYGIGKGRVLQRPGCHRLCCYRQKQGQKGRQ